MKKIFRFAFTPLIITLLILSLLISLGGTAINLYNLIIATINSQKFQSSCLLGLCLILTVFILFVLIRSGYKVKDGKLLLYFGFIKSTFPLEKALNLTYFEDKNMLILFLDGGEYSRIVIKKEKFSSFLNALREENNKITYFEKNSSTD